MKPDPQPREAQWGHLALMAVFILATGAFLYDTLSQSWRLDNIIVILPVSILVLLLCAWQIFGIIRMRSGGHANLASAQSPKDDASASETSALVRIGLFMGVLGLYVLGLIYFYFDVSTFLFVWLALWVQGEKRYIFGTIYALLLSLLVIWGIKQMVPFPFETLLF